MGNIYIFIRKSSFFIYQGLQTGEDATLRRPPEYSRPGDSELLDDVGVGGMEYEVGDEAGDEVVIVVAGVVIAVAVVVVVVGDSPPTRTVNGDILSNSFSRWPKCDINFVPSLTSTPGVAAKHLDTSLAQCV